MKNRNRLLFLSKPATKEQQVYVADTETWRHGRNFAFLYIESLYSDSDRKLFFDKNDFLKWCKKKTYNSNIIIYFHNCQFDLSSILTDLDVYKNKKIESGSRIIRLQYKIHGKRSKKGMIEFRDSLALLPLSVDQLGKGLGFPKGETPDKFKHPTPTTITKDDIDYCIQDVKIVKMALNQLLQVYRSALGDGGSRLPLTLAKMSYTIWSKFFRDQFGGPEYYKINTEVNEMFQKSYYGGRVECFYDGPTMDDFEFKDFSYYDVNSEYPFVMKEYEYPDFRSACIFEGNIDSGRLMDLMRKFFVVVDIRLRNPDPKFETLFLPCRNDEGVLDYHGEVFDGCLCHPELEEALMMGWQVEEIRKVSACKRIRPFEKFVDYFYGMRVLAKENDDPREFCYKILMNSLYGKFGQKDRGEEIVEDEIIDKMFEMGRVDDGVLYYKDNSYKVEYLDIENRYLISIEDYVECRNQWFGFASAVTSYARVWLHRIIRQNLDTVVYCDTDGIQCLGLEGHKINLGGKLGELKLEYTGKGYWFDKKNYVHFIEKDGEIVMKARAKGIKDYSGNAFSIQIFEKPLKYKEARRQKKVWGDWEKVKKKCRKVIKGLPLEITESYAEKKINEQLLLYTN
jgi:hypothetical protein